MELLSLENLNELLQQVETEEIDKLSDEELGDAIRRIHDGFIIKAPIFDPGFLVWRIVKVESLPSHRNRVGYPPAELVRTCGRANLPKEQVFYGAVDHLMPCIFECNLEENGLYCASAWRSTARVICNHLGYSSASLSEVIGTRNKPFFAAVENDTERNALIRDWQGRIFTRRVPKGSERLYRAGLAIKKFALGPLGAPAPGGFTGFDGLVYPSVATGKLYDNIALLPTAIDQKFDLIEVRFFGVRFAQGLSATIDAHGGFKITVVDYDCAVPDQEGRLIWGSARKFSIEKLLAPSGNEKVTSEPSR